MRVLYICGDYIISPVHRSLVKELDAIGIEVKVFVPINHNTRSVQRASQEFKTGGSEVIYSPALKLYHRILYKAKINQIVKYVEQSVDLSKIDIIHSSLLCNEGGVAYEISKKYGIKYLSAIRNSDLNDYFRVFKWRIPYFKKIAHSADKLICISKLYSKRIERYFGGSLYGEMIPKLQVLTNGLYDLYLDNRSYKTSLGDKIKIVFTGGYQRNKNILGVYEAVKLLRNKGYNVEYTAIGNNLQNHYEPDYAKEIIQEAESNSWFHVVDAQPKEKLINSLREYDVFAMLSHTETFGLSYIEALSQGLPIVYTEGEGFDCMYEEGEVGYHANSRNVDDIASAIERVIKQYNQIVNNIKSKDLSVYKWEKIALSYKDVYRELISK